MNTQQWRQAWRLVEDTSGQPDSVRHSAILSACRDPAVIAKALELLNRCRDSDSRAGTQIDHYLILEELGRGGMGEVYAATDLNLDRSVAVKFLPRDVLQIESAVSRFLTEAKASSALNHPNIVTIHEFIRGENVLAIVMELIDGKTLRDAFTGPALLPDFLPAARQIALAMAAAHARGILHRDIKPENIMLRRDGIAKVVDFGLAGLIPGPVQDESAGSNRQTTPGGTPAYMSPEQTSMQPLTPASDVYSMGVVFHELLTGCLPDSPGADDARAHLPPAMRALLEQMLRSSPEARPSASEVTHALERAQAGSFSRLAIVAAIVATVVTALSLVIVSIFRQPESNLNARLSTARVAPVTRFAGFEFEPNLSSDGRQVAFVWDGDQGNADIYVRSLDSAKRLRLTSNPAHDLSPAWSPDGRSIAFVRAYPDKREVFIVPASGGPERLLCESRAYHPIWLKDASTMRNFSGPAWSPDGQYLALTDRSSSDERDSIYFVSVQSGEKRRVTSPGKSDTGDYSPAFSPDGRMIAYARAFSERGMAEIHTQAMGNSRVRQLPVGVEAIRGLTWLSADRIVFASTSRPKFLWSISARGGNPEALTTIGKNLSQPSASANGRSLVYVEEFSSANVWRLPIRPGGTAAPLITSSTANDSAQYSPDGSKIVFVSDRSEAQEIWIANADGSSAIQLTSSNGSPVGTPHWAPDGRRIVYDSVKDRVSVIYVIDATGGTPRLLGDGRRDSMMPNWSRDGQFIYFVSKDSSAMMQVWKMPVEGGSAVQITTGGGGESVEAPDGKTLYYLKGERGIWQVPVSGGVESLFPGLEKISSSRYFAVTRNGMYFLAAESRPWNIYFYDFASKRMSPIGIIERTPRFRTPSLSVSPDERWLIYAQEDQSGSDLTLLENIK